MKKELQEIMDKIVTWSNETFGYQQRTVSVVSHLEEEVKELKESVFTYINYLENHPYNPRTIEARIEVRQELADCLILILDVASKCNTSAEQLIEAVEKKHQINTQRKWGKPKVNGVVNHIE